MWPGYEAKHLQAGKSFMCSWIQLYRPGVYHFPVGSGGTATDSLTTFSNLDNIC